MRIFVTGASGWIGTATTLELMSASHEVLGLARSDASAERLEQLGAAVHRGSLEDLDSLRAGAAATDGVVHLGYDHDFTQMERTAQLDRSAIETFGEALAGSGRPLVVASGVLGLAQGRPGTEQDRPDPAAHPRIANAEVALGLADRGVRPVVVRFAPTVHGAGDHGFVSVIAATAREKGASAWVGDGTSRWPAVHRDDAARLVRLAVETAAPGTVLHAVAEEGVTSRDIAEALGRSLGLPTTSVAPEQAYEHFGWMGFFFGVDAPASSTATQALLGWEPTGPTLVADIDAGAYAG